MEGDKGICKVPASAGCCGGWRAVKEDDGGGGREGVVEEGSMEKVYLGVERWGHSGGRWQT